MSTFVTLKITPIIAKISESSTDLTKLLEVAKRWHLETHFVGGETFTEDNEILKRYRYRINISSVFDLTLCEIQKKAHALSRITADIATTQ